MTIDHTWLLANLKRVFLADEKKPIYVWGTGKTVRDLLYIDDLAHS